jgi:hypothetical protein
MIVRDVQDQKPCTQHALFRRKQATPLENRAIARFWNTI